MGGRVSTRVRFDASRWCDFEALRASPNRKSVLSDKGSADPVMKQRQVLSEEELAALLAADLETVRAQNRFWFWVRSGFVLVYIGFMLAALLLAPDRIFAKFDIPEQLLHALTHEYVTLRVVTVVAMTALYLLSYWRGWYFPYVALAAVLIAAGNLINDFFSLYIFVKPEAMMMVQIIIAVRVLIVVFLVMNFVGARKDFNVLQ